MKLILFENVHRLMQAEALLKEQGIAREILPVPKEYSTECGMCLRLEERHLAAAGDALGALHIQYKTVEEP